MSLVRFLLVCVCVWGGGGGGGGGGILPVESKKSGRR